MTSTVLHFSNSLKTAYYSFLIGSSVRTVKDDGN